MRILHSNWLFVALPLVIFAVVVASTMSVVAGPGGNPDAGLTDSERDAKYTQGRATAVAQDAQTVRDFLASGQSVSSLPQVGALVNYDAEALTPRQARVRATSVFRGVVTEQRFEPDPDYPEGGMVVSTIRVTEWLKGDRQDSLVTLEQVGAPAVGEDGGFILGVHDQNPPVRLGSDVIVFTDATGRSGRARTIPLTGVEIASDRTVQPNDSNAQFAVLRGRPVEELLATLRAP